MELMDRSAIIAEYKKLRSKGVALNKELVKTLSKHDIELAARRLGMLKAGTLVFETEDEVSVMMDYAIHEVYHDGLNAIDRMLRDKPPEEGSDELQILQSLKASRYTLFTVERTIPGFGLMGTEGVTRTPTLLVDISFSHSAVPGLALATRLHSPKPGWSMTTGASLPMTEEALEGLIGAMEDYQRRHGDEPPDAERSTMMIRECIKAGASRSISYAEPGALAGTPDRSMAPIRHGSAKVGRNDPCPCGSGRKYKKCCGRVGGSFCCALSPPHSQRRPAPSSKRRERLARRTDRWPPAVPERRYVLRGTTAYPGATHRDGSAQQTPPGLDPRCTMPG